MATLAGVQWNGLDSFKRELQVLTAQLVTEAETILVGAAHAAAGQVRAAYPEKRGVLRRRVTVKKSRGRLLAGAEVKSRAPHAWIYEHGTVSRQNKAGANRGRMPATPTFVPITDAARQAALAEVIDLLTQHGATSVTGDPDVD